MDIEKLNKANDLMDKIRCSQSNLKDVKNDLYKSELLEEEEPRGFGKYCKSNDQSFRFNNSLIFVPKSFIKNQLLDLIDSIEKDIKEFQKEFDKL